MVDPIWCVMPVLAGPAMTEAALSDLLAQSVPTRVLIINQGVDDDFRDRLERLSEQEPRLYVWHHQPPMPSLSASWNLALDTIWRTGGAVAFVVNNDVRLHPRTIEALSLILKTEHALFVSALGVQQAQFDDCLARFTEPGWTIQDAAGQRGGPDFSCYLISQTCHANFRFDERFIPAFCEDLDYHRRLLLAGEGSRIFSVNVPYLHLASQTLKLLPEPEAQRIRGAIEHQSRTYYKQKWGGPVNEETYLEPFGGSWSERAKREDGTATTPYLQAHPLTSARSSLIPDEGQYTFHASNLQPEEPDGEDARRAEPAERTDSASEAD